MPQQANKSTFIRVLYISVLLTMLYTPLVGQKVLQNRTVNSTLTNTDADSLPNNTIEAPLQADTVVLKYNDEDIDGPISYHASDSIVYDLKNQKLYLYGNAYMKYTDFELNSHEIEYDWTSGTLLARGEIDTTGELISYAEFTEASGSYQADSMQYNFKTKKGRTYDVVTEQDGAFIHSEIVQKNQYDEWYGFKTKYTTCTNVEHPHFYLGTKKSKVIPDKVMVTGPVNLKVAEINTPLVLPFGIFPTKAGRRSGFIMPTYGEQPSLGFFLKDFGYFWATNDHLSLTFLGEVYTRGTFGVSVNARYRKNYKYNGGLFIKYFRTPATNKLLSNDGISNDFSIDWSHYMDAKARPNNTFSATVTGRTSNYNTNSFQTDEQLLEVQVNSNINYTRRLPKINSSFQLGASHNQNFRNNTIRITLPEVSFNASRFTPFQKKIQTDKKKVYEKIGITYTARAKATISTIDSLLLTRDALDDLDYGMIQTARVDMPVNLFKYFVVNPSFTYNERWYFKEEEQYFYGDSIVENGQTVYKNTLSSFDNGFYDVRDFSFGTSVSTTLTGIYNFNKRKKVKAIRHIIKPTLNYTFRPDFSNERWGYYDSYTNFDTQKEVEYNKYQNLSLYGTPTAGLQNALTIDITNNFEMKILQKKDTSTNFKKIPLLEQFRVNTGYNFSADSLKLSPLKLTAQSRLFNNLVSWNAGATFDAYQVNEQRQRIEEFHFKNGKGLMRFDNAYFSMNLNLAGKSNGKKPQDAQFGTVEEREYIARNPDLFYDFTIPWSLSVGYQLNISKGVAGNLDSTLLVANALTFGGHINITPNWQLNVSSGFDIRNKEMTLTNVRVQRDLHCWVLAFDWTAFPLNRQRYEIDLHVKSEILQELKLTRKQPPGTLVPVF